MVFSKRLTQRIAIFLVVALLTALLGTMPVAMAAMKMVANLSNVSLYAGSVPNALYLSEVYKGSNGYFGIAGADDFWNSYLVTSADGVSWDVKTKISSLLYINGKYIGIGENSNGERALVQSDDGSTWNVMTYYGMNYPSLSYRNGMAVVTYSDSNWESCTMVSSDLSNWYELKGDVPENANLNSLYYIGGSYIIFEQGDSLSAYTTKTVNENKTVWSKSNVPANTSYYQWNGDTIGLSGYTTVNDEWTGMYYITKNGITWEQKSWADFDTAMSNNQIASAKPTPTMTLGNGLDYEYVVDEDSYRTYLVGSYITLNGAKKEAVFYANGKKLASGGQYIYDAAEYAPYISYYQLDGITDVQSAIDAIKEAANGLYGNEKTSSTAIDCVTLFAEEAIARAAAINAESGDVTVSLESIETASAAVVEAKALAEQALAECEITANREIDAKVLINVPETATLSVTIDPSAGDIAANTVSIKTSGFALSLSKEAIAANTADGELVITITESAQALVAANNGAGSFAYDPDAKSYNMTTSKPLTENVKISLPVADSYDTNYKAVVNSKDEAVGGKYNPTTGTLDAKVKANDTYTIKDNYKDFTDISDKSYEMQNAIKILAAKGIINGTSATTFGPDGTIDRSQIAALIMRALSKLDADENGGFSDVAASDWFFGAVGSAKKYGIMNGTSDTTFEPKANILKEQIVAIAARTLRSAMKYKDPSDAAAVLSIYADSSAMPSWGTADFALATRESLVVKRTDKKFMPKDTMTRGDAAIILYRMFTKLW